VCSSDLYKLAWLTALNTWLKDELAQHPKLALLGDYNIAPEDRDVHDPAAWAGNVLVSEPERAHFRGLLNLGLKDGFRLFEQAEKSFSWWDYRAAGFRRNLGLRIDHILLSAPLASRCTAAEIDKAPRKLERPSDHTPVVVTLSD
jgi:exodeoxyribonuclease-3